MTVHLESSSPPHFDRIQLVLRLLVLVVLGWVGVTSSWLVGLLYVVLPLLAAIEISSSGSEAYVTEVGPKVWRALAWLLQLQAYVTLIVDRFPTGGDDRAHFQIEMTGTPTVGSAVSRLLTSIPSGIVLAVLWCGSCVLWVLSIGIVLIGGHMPRWILAYQRGVLLWQARLVAYHASLVAEYPAFTFATHELLVVK